MKTEDSHTQTSADDRRRAWLASLLLQEQSSWFGRFTLNLRRLIALGRGQRRRLERKAAVSLAGAALLLSLGVGLMQPPAALAANIAVSSGTVVIADDGYCSLPEAIINANNDSQLYTSTGECIAGAGADTITLSGGTYTLNSAYGGYAYYSDNGLPLIDSAITIEGNGATIVRNGIQPHFRVMAVTGSGSLILNDTTVSGGYSEEDGGGLYIYGGGYALIQNSTITGNTAYDDGGGLESEGETIIDHSSVYENNAGELGGGISTEAGGTLTIRNYSYITDNYADDGGGGVVADESGQVTITTSTISGNSTDYFGGGIATYKTTVLIDGSSTISDNYAPVYGGGADFYLSNVTIEDSLISGNEIFRGMGGGISFFGSTATISNSVIDENSIYDYSPPYNIGAGIATTYTFDYASQQTVHGDVTITDSTISGNTGAFAGGGAAVYFGSSLTIDSSTIKDNEALYGGGVMNVFANLGIVNSTISGNHAVFDGSGFYGGIAGGVGIIQPIGQGQYQTQILTSTITGNSADEAGGGILSASYDPVYLGGNIVAGNTAPSATEIEDGAGTVISYGFNVLGHSGETNAAAFYGFTPDATDITATSDGTLPTLLNAILDTTLAFNGGPTETHALISGSPAIDLIPSTYCTGEPIYSVDQRDEPRNIDIPGQGSDTTDLCDAGAYELEWQATNFCPANDPGVGNERTDILGIGMGDTSRAKKVSKLVIPYANDLTRSTAKAVAKQEGLNGARASCTPTRPTRTSSRKPVSVILGLSLRGTDLDINNLTRPYVKARWFIRTKPGSQAPAARVHSLSDLPDARGVCQRL
ncbi:MAG: right-handed parallel beta-helix repeat-containing protein [Chloroflexota bacterium]